MGGYEFCTLSALDMLGLGTECGQQKQKLLLRGLHRRGSIQRGGGREGERADGCCKRLHAGMCRHVAPERCQVHGASCKTHTQVSSTQAAPYQMA